MNIVYDDETLATFRQSGPDAALLALVEWLVDRTKNQGFWASSCIAIQPSPDLLGFDPVADPPEWGWRNEHEGGWVELALILDDFTWLVLVRSGSPLAQQE